TFSAFDATENRARTLSREKVSFMVALQVPDHLKFPFPAGSWEGRIRPRGGVAARVDALSHPTYRSHGPGPDGLRSAGRAYALAFASPVLAENSSDMRGEG